MEKTTKPLEVNLETISQTILLIRGQRVMLDFHLAELYEVSTGDLNQAVRRNLARFPEDFMLQLSWDEVEMLKNRLGLPSPQASNSRSQIVILKQGRNIKYRPYAFTEYGVAMLSSVLKSERAIQANIEIMRTFGKLRKMIFNHAELAQKITKLESRYDAQFKAVFDAIRQLMEPPAPAKRKIGFMAKATDAAFCAPKSSIDK